MKTQDEFFKLMMFGVFPEPYFLGSDLDDEIYFD